MNIAGSMLNICAILSQVKKYYIKLFNNNYRHKKAIIYAKNAILKSE